MHIDVPEEERFAHEQRVRDLIQVRPATVYYIIFLCAAVKFEGNLMS